MSRNSRPFGATNVELRPVISPSSQRGRRKCWRAWWPSCRPPYPRFVKVEATRIDNDQAYRRYSHDPDSTSTPASSVRNRPAAPV